MPGRCEKCLSDETALEVLSTQLIYTLTLYYAIRAELMKTNTRLLAMAIPMQLQSRDQTQAIKPADWSVWSRDRFCKLQAT